MSLPNLENVTVSGTENEVAVVNPVVLVFAIDDLEAGVEGKMVLGGVCSVLAFVFPGAKRRRDWVVNHDGQARTVASLETET